MLLTFFLGCLAEAAAQTVTRGPYLQLGTPTSVVVRWRTDVATDSRVAYGPSPAFGSFAVDPTPTTEHVVTVAGLLPGTKYFYAIGTTTGSFAPLADQFFVTAPLPGVEKPTRIWVLGDSGHPNTSSRAVRDAYEKFTGARHTDLWLMLGDNAYYNGTDAEYQVGVFEQKYEKMLRKSVLWPTLGNHDGYSASSAAQTGPYYDIFSLPAAGEAGGVPSGTEAYYAFDYGNIHFICLDSFDSSTLPSGPMAAWLAADLAATNQKWRVAYFHHPPHSGGSHNSDTESWMVNMRANITPILEAGGVDLVLCGHNHIYERSMMIDGHYGTKAAFGPAHVVDGGDGVVAGDGAYRKPAESGGAHEGTVYVTAGTSAWVTTGSALDHPAMLVELEVLGSLVIDVDGDQLDVRFIDEKALVRDRFTIVKGPVKALDRAHTAILPGAIHRYDDSGVDLGTAWRAPGYDDAAWPAGPAPLGYGESYIATPTSWGPDAGNVHPTTYFRTTFTLPFAPLHVASARLWANYDDGFVAFLNGVKVAQSASLPSATVNYGTIAGNHEAGAFELFAVPPSTLVAGANVLAIEVHQSGGASTDLVLDAAFDLDAFVPVLGGAAAGDPLAAASLFLNGSTGGAARAVEFTAGTDLTIAVAPPALTAAAAFALFGMVGTPDAADAYVLAAGVGTMCFPPSSLVAAPDRFLLASSMGLPGAWFAAPPAPWSVTFLGAPAGIVGTLQGVVLDAQGVWRVTNGVRLEVVP